MREITATEASRRFADMLDAVEHNGISYAIRRNGRVIASVQPVAAGNGGIVKRLLDQAEIDEGWDREVRELRAALPPEVPDWDA